VLQCNRVSPLSDGSVLASYGATSGAATAFSALFKTSNPEIRFAVLATASVAEDFGWGGGRWSSPTVSYRERAFAYVQTRARHQYVTELNQFTPECCTAFISKCCIKRLKVFYSYGRLPTHSSRREFGITDTERSVAVAIEAALRPFSRARVSLTLLSSDGTYTLHFVHQYDRP
jgi:hypothetical protein